MINIKVDILGVSKGVHISITFFLHIMNTSLPMQIENKVYSLDLKEARRMRIAVLTDLTVTKIVSLFKGVFNMHFIDYSHYCTHKGLQERRIYDTLQTIL